MKKTSTATPRINYSSVRISHEISVVIKIIRLCRGTNCNIINLLNAFTIIKGKERNWPAIRFHVSRDFLCEQHRLCMLKKYERRLQEKKLYILSLLSSFHYTLLPYSIFLLFHFYINTHCLECWMPCANWKFYRSHKTHKKYKTHV